MSPCRRRFRASLACSSPKVSTSVLMPASRSERKEFLAIAAGEIGNGSDAAFPPQDGIRECGHIAHVDAGAHDSPAFGGVTQCLRDQSADRREQDGGIHLLGWC